MLIRLLAISLVPLLLSCWEASSATTQFQTAEQPSVPKLPYSVNQCEESMVLDGPHSGCIPAAESAPPEAGPSPGSNTATAPAIRPKGDIWIRPEPSPSQRDARAFSTKEDLVRTLFQNAGGRFPPHKQVFRVFKAESDLEVWAAADPKSTFVHIATYPVCYHSGDEGPKRAEGDGQVPEGFYVIDALNKASSYYLSMHVNYPNASDKVLSNKRSPGSAIMIHGNCVSIGCLAMGDENIQELWVMAKSLKKLASSLHVFIAPGRDIGKFISESSDPVLVKFWTNIKEGFDLFESEKRVPGITVDRHGMYHFE